MPITSMASNDFIANLLKHNWTEAIVIIQNPKTSFLINEPILFNNVITTPLSIFAQQAVSSNDSNSKDYQELAIRLIRFNDLEFTKYISQETPLLFAAKNGNNELVTLLLKAGANNNALNSSGKNALSLAADAFVDCPNCANRLKETIITLIKNGADIQNTRFWMLSHAFDNKRDEFRFPGLRNIWEEYVATKPQDSLGNYLTKLESNIFILKKIV